MDDLSAYLHAFKMYIPSPCLTQVTGWLCCSISYQNPLYSFPYCLWDIISLIYQYIDTFRLVFILDISCSNTSLGSITIKSIFSVQSYAAFSAHLYLQLCEHTSNEILQMTSRSEPWFNIKVLFYQWTKCRCGDKTVLRSSYLHNGISCTGKMTSQYWTRALLYVHLDRDEWSLKLSKVCKTSCIYHCISPKK